MIKRWTERHEFYQKALRQLINALTAYPTLNEREKDGAIQRFEFTVELAWKTLQDYFAQEIGYADGKGPRIVLKQAIKDSLITSGHARLQILDSRNELTHVYDETQSRYILDDIANIYIGLLVELEQFLTSKA